VANRTQHFLSTETSNSDRVLDTEALRRVHR